MNTTEVTMSQRSHQSKHGLVAHTVALEAAGIILQQALKVAAGNNLTASCFSALNGLGLEEFEAHCLELLGLRKVEKA